MNKTSKARRRNYVVVLFAIVLIVAAAYLLTAHPFRRAAVVRAPSKPILKAPAETTPSGSASANSSGVTDSQSTSDGVNQGNDTDKNGQVPSDISTDPSDWSTSSSGLITVKTPQENGTLQSGSILAGSASVSKIQYTLIDDQLGVISQGFINVVNGNFSAAINFSSHSKTGRLDVFSTDTNGRETNEVQIDVSF